MLFRNIVPTPKGTLSLHQALELCNIYLENAYKSADHDIALILCHDAEAALSQVKGANKRRSADPKDVGYKALREGVATAYIDLGKLLENRGYQSEAQAIRKKAEKWGGNPHNPGRLAQAYTNSNVQLANVTTSSRDSQATGSLQTMDRNNHPNRAATVLANVFAENIRPPTIEFKLPETDERLGSTPQLVCCLALLQASHSPDDTLGPVVQEWLQITAQDADEQERLYTLAVEVLRTFKRDELKDTKSVAEVVCLAPILHKDAFQELLRELYSGINHSGLLNCHQLEGLARLIQDADPGYLSPDDLVKVLELLSSRLRGTHQGSAQHVHQLTLAISQVLDAMADTHVSGLDREKLHEPLSSFLNGLKNSSDPFLVYQAAYAHQALLCVPDDEKVWQGVMRRTKRVIRGVSGLVSAVKGLDLNKFIEGLEDIHKGLEGASKVTELVHTAYKDVTSLAQSGQGFLDCLKEGFSFERKRDWYTALRVADTLLQDGELSTFKVLVCTAPCRRDPAFQWGVCQRLGEIAINPMWDSATRRSAVTFLGELYKNDDLWGRQPSIKQWILNILMRLASSPDSDGQGMYLRATTWCMDIM
ncbi:hypothetical protein BGX31_010229 [Mortierella sp. GBA43]|nr:hypothetical protein BGX31_010229 [Mortierella sp. GBA43]